MSTAKVHKPQGGDKVIVESGGTITIRSGGALVVEAGGALARQGSIADLNASSATSSEIATKLNSLLAALRTAGIIAP